MTRTAWYVVAAIVILFLIWLGYNTYFKKPKAPDTPGGSNSSGGSSGGSGATRNDNFPLGLGSYGTRVRNIQYILNKYYGTNLDEDGDLGPLTLAQIQAKFGVTQIDEARYQSIVNPFNIPFVD